MGWGGRDELSWWRERGGSVKVLGMVVGRFGGLSWSLGDEMGADSRGIYEKKGRGELDECTRLLVMQMVGNSRDT